jgi:hypothetical protein
MDDRDLLESAAKAVGYKPHGWDEDINRLLVEDDQGPGRPWNPLRDDGDALRLAVKLHIDMVFHVGDDELTVQGIAPAPGNPDEGWTFTEGWGDDKEAATRRAIVRAAAAIGKKVDAPQNAG